jgi:adenine specific DNA methylase Mod
MLVAVGGRGRINLFTRGRKKDPIELEERRKLEESKEPSGLVGTKESRIPGDPGNQRTKETQGTKEVQETKEFKRLEGAKAFPRN